MMFRYLAALTVFAMSLPAWQTERRLKDKAEFALIATIRDERDNQRRLELLHQWERQYPKSDYRQERYNLLLTALQGLGRPRAMIQTAVAMAQDDPQGLGQYWLTALAIPLQDTSEQALSRAEQAAQSLLRNLAEMYSPSIKPGAVPESAWLHDKLRNEVLAHRTLGWVAYNRRQWTIAQQELTSTLQSNSQDAEASFWLGSSILAESLPNKRSKGLYHLARSLVVTGSGALTPDALTIARTYLEETCIQLTGDAKIIPQLLSVARKGAFPPSSFLL